MVPYKILYRKKFYRKKNFSENRAIVGRNYFFLFRKEFYIIVLDKLCHAKY
jgi:hypothetical protein